MRWFRIRLGRAWRWCRDKEGRVVGTRSQEAERKRVPGVMRSVRQRRQLTWGLRLGPLWAALDPTGRQRAAHKVRT